MIALLLACATVAAPPTPQAAVARPRTVVVRSAVTGSPVSGVRVRTGGSAAITGTDGVATVVATGGDTLHLGRVGYAPVRLVVGDADTLHAALREPVSVLPSARTAGTADPIARASVTRDVRAAREASQPTLGALVATMPGVAARSSRGEATWQLRGARAEQVLVTLDGIALNDPASGTADAADLPLAALASVRVIPGADGSAGGGALGGTIALASGDAPVLSLSTGAFGARLVEGAATVDALGVRVRAGAAWREARNDFAFINSDGATGSGAVERRSNNDERRLALFATASTERLQLVAFASSGDRGLSGPMNVRSAEGDRAHTDRALLRAMLGGGNWTVSGGVRTLQMRYENAFAPTLDTDARTVSPEGEVGLRAWGLALRAGAGGDVLHATGLADASRTRGWVAAERGLSYGSWRGTAGVRVDAIAGAPPLGSPWVGLERTGDFAPYVRATQAFRAPTLYDLYFAAPQRLGARELRPERTLLDAEAGVRARLAAGALRVSVSAFTRTVDDAIIWFPGNFAWSPSNVGRERTVGAEATVQVASDNSDVTLWGATTRAELEAGALTAPTPYVPALSGGLTVGVRTSAGAWTATLRGIGRRAFVVAPASADTELPAVGLADLAWSRPVAVAGTTLLVAAGVTNLFDAGWESVRRFPSVGRSWTVSLTFFP